MSKRPNLSLETLDQKVLFAADFGYAGAELASSVETAMVAENTDANELADLFCEGDEVAVNINNSHRTAGDEISVQIDNNHQTAGDEVAVNIDNSHRTAGDEVSVQIDHNHQTAGDEVAVNIDNSHRTAGDEVSVQIDHNHRSEEVTSPEQVDEFFQLADSSEQDFASMFGGDEIADWSGNCFGGC